MVGLAGQGDWDVQEMTNPLKNPSVDRGFNVE